MSDSNLLKPRYWPTWFALGLLRLIGLLPLPVIHKLGGALGGAIFRLFRSRREITIRNLERCFPDLESAKHNDIAHQHFRELGKSMLSVGVNWWASPQRLDKLVKTRNQEYYDQALAAGKNIILLAPHFIGLEIGGIYLSKQTPVVSMYQYTKNGLIDHYVKQGRGRFGAQMIERKAELRVLIKEIRSGKPFYYLPDQAPGRRHAVFVPFFDISTATFPMLGKFAQLGKAVVIPCFTRQLPQGGGYEVIFQPPLAPFPTGDMASDTAYMNKVIEDGVRSMPEQYFWVHKRFKTRPDGEADFYQ